MNSTPATDGTPEQGNVKRPPVVLYEVATNRPDGGTFLYRVEGDVIEQGDGWLTIWGDALTVALRIPEADLRHIRRVDPDEPYPTLDGAHCGEECSEGHTYAGRCELAGKSTTCGYAADSERVGCPYCVTEPMSSGYLHKHVARMHPTVSEHLRAIIREEMRQAERNRRPQ